MLTSMVTQMRMCGMLVNTLYDMLEDFADKHDWIVLGIYAIGAVVFCAVNIAVFLFLLSMSVGVGVYFGGG